MCGIVGYIGSQNATEIVLNGLKRLEYRGYDSAGIAAIQDNKIEIRRDIGKLSNLRKKVEASPIHSHISIGHTRWATHGKPSEQNAHPHLSMNQDYVIVHNGIVENCVDLRHSLRQDGFAFQSETDSEVIAHLIEKYSQNGANGDLVESTRKAVQDLRGAHAIVVMSRKQPHQLVAVRIGNAGGIAIGLSEGGYFIASDIPAILEHTRAIVFLESHQMAIIDQDEYHVQKLDSTPVTTQRHLIKWDNINATKGEYAHFMQKEIFEQPQSLMNTLRGRIDFETYTLELPEMNLSTQITTQIQRIVTVACGTSYYSAQIGKFFFEQLTRLHIEVDYASEYRYRSPIINERTAVLAITQSGETVDTLAAMDEARRNNAIVWSIVNAVGSQAMRLSDGVIGMNVGPEIGVASTKTFTTSIVDQYLLALYLAQLQNTLSNRQIRCHIEAISKLPEFVGRVLELDQEICALAEKFDNYHNFLFLGRGVNYPVALEGALKLKEISYIHAEGYPAGEMKHGPIALIDEQMPIVAIAVQDSLYEKMTSQIQQAKARDGIVIALATEGDSFIQTVADHVLYVPDAPELLYPIINVIPLQLLAYHIAVLRGVDVDQPRNLAKSVTVE